MGLALKAHYALLESRERLDISASYRVDLSGDAVGGSGGGSHDAVLKAKSSPRIFHIHISKYTYRHYN